MMAFRRRKLEQQHEVDKKDHAPVAWKEGSRPDGREGGICAVGQNALVS